MKRSKAEYKEYWLFLYDEEASNLNCPRWTIRIHALSKDHAKQFAERAWHDFKQLPWLWKLKLKDENNLLIYTLPRKN